MDEPTNRGTHKPWVSEVRQQKPVRRGQTGMVFAVMLLGLLIIANARSETVVLMDLDTGSRFDITETLRYTANIGNITGVTALNAVPGAADEWLLVSGDGVMQFLDAATLQPLFRITESAMRDLFTLPAGTGTCSALKWGGPSVDTLLYYDPETGEWFGIDLDTGWFGWYGRLDLPSAFYSGFGYTSPKDIGMIVQDAPGEWRYESLPERWPVDLDLASLFDGTPVHVSEFKYPLPGGEAMHFMLAVLDGSSPGTSTPTPGPGTPTATPTPHGSAAYDVVIAMGLGETLWRIDAETYAMEPDVTVTGQAPNRIVHHAGELFVVNSLSHSVTVHDPVSLALKREMSTGVGSNPFDMVFVDASSFYVTQFNSNRVSRIDASSGVILEVIDMPGDLPADPGKTTAPRPSGITCVGDTAYVACANLDSSYVAGGPGVIVTIDIPTDQVTGWFESGGRNCTGVAWSPNLSDWIWTVNTGDYSSGQGFHQNGTIAVFQTGNPHPLHTLQVGDAPIELVFGPQRAYFASAADGRIGRIDTGSLSIMSAVTLPNAGQGLNLVSGLAAGPDNRLWVLEFNHDVACVLDMSQDDALIQQLTVGWGPDALVIVER